jgi:anti-sigma factor RsiW
MLALQATGDCDDIRERLSDYLDGELDPAAHARVALHLAACAACAKIALELAVVVGALHALGCCGSVAGEPH